ncbi:TPA: hypothetical protein PW733_002018 [Mannheimia haemolytica]|uniref:Uncharacterized protein n=1 Tax=Mannheimia haemolytica TaxID=75985 RepID=A0A248ZYT4_MANHA|nr:hypothetical protein [Mannheimia haemolytica]AWW71169.1 hypothetical protein C4O86_04925 [Pasteurellaceae bacterium 12565]AGI32287.1 hypothetical protein D650_10180 [Mannheimia haemolytica USDA-ARS-USMARC-183]AGI35682.1 hypothetical protein D648_16780 [Mannheimia haemolytica USDA-ARS-USMARC-185]AGK02144.1 hypothetical protein MHH_c16940 [Mannheimia haemolytica M42548]AGQ24993.1 hypothetical protein F382_03025 [Mannheimia haemolytica D153]
MKNNILITYDLNKSGQNYAALIEKIKTLGAWAKVQQSAWYLHTSYSSKEVLEMLSTVTDYNDSLFVAQLSEANWRGLSNEVSKFIQEQWWK